MKTKPSSEYGVLQHSAILGGERRKTERRGPSIRSNIISSPLVLLMVHAGFNAQLGRLNENTEGSTPPWNPPKKRKGILSHISNTYFISAAQLMLSSGWSCAAVFSWSPSSLRHTAALSCCHRVPIAQANLSATGTSTEIVASYQKHRFKDSFTKALSTAAHNGASKHQNDTVWRLWLFGSVHIRLRKAMPVFQTAEPEVAKTDSKEYSLSWLLPLLC